MPDLWDDASDRARNAAQADSLAGLPVGTREHVIAIARALIRSGSRFTFPRCKPPRGETVPLRSVYGELAQHVRDVVDQHPGALGSVTTMLQRLGEIEHKGRAKTVDPDKRRYVGVWQGVR